MMEPAAEPNAQSPQNVYQKLSAAEHHGPAKTILRAITILVAVIGLGCMAWAVQNVTPYGPFTYDLDDRWTLYWTLITFGISIIWCLVCILVLFLRRPWTPVHPGVAVGIDLVLWLGYVVTVLFATFGLVSLFQFGSDGEISSYSDYGAYTQASNGTWVWSNESSYSYYNSYYGDDEPRMCNASDANDYYWTGAAPFSTCAEEDAWVNSLWHKKLHRQNVELAGVVCQYLALLLHLTLFIWACVDTARRNRSKTNKAAEQLAADIVMKMVRDGAIVRAPNESLQPHSHAGQGAVTAESQGPVVGSAAEKSGGAEQMQRYA